MDSWPIAHELETQYPAPSLRLFDNPVVVKVRDLTGGVMMPLRAHLLPRVPLLLPERSAEYFYETRRVRFGKSLQEVAGEASEANWEEARAPAREMGDLLREHGGPFFLGDVGEFGRFFVFGLQFFEEVVVGLRLTTGYQCRMRISSSCRRCTVSSG